VLPSFYLAVGPKVLRWTGQTTKSLALADRATETSTQRPCQVLQVRATGAGFLRHPDSSAFRESPSLPTRPYLSELTGAD
jgi:hypothetical protein